MRTTRAGRSSFKRKCWTGLCVQLFERWMRSFTNDETFWKPNNQFWFDSRWHWLINSTCSWWVRRRKTRGPWSRPDSYLISVVCRQNCFYERVWENDNTSREGEKMHHRRDGLNRGSGCLNLGPHGTGKRFIILPLSFLCSSHCRWKDLPSGRCSAQN